LKSGIHKYSPPEILRLVPRRLQEGRQPFPNAAEFHIASDDLGIPKALQTVRDLQIMFLVGTSASPAQYASSASLPPMQYQ
jgi:hypothetical protein